MGNPYHEPETAAAILKVFWEADINRQTATALYSLAVPEDQQAALPPCPSCRRAIEIVLARVKMGEWMRRDLMRALVAERQGDLFGPGARQSP